MRLDDCYRILDLPPTASHEDVKRAHRDLMKVWHPDRFGHDAALRQKAEEKLKAINEAYETIIGSRSAGRWNGAPGDEPRRQAPPARELMRRYRFQALMAAAAAVYFLLRRPTPGGLIVAVVLFAVAFFFLTKMRNLGDR